MEENHNQRYNVTNGVVLFFHTQLKLEGEREMIGSRLQIKTFIVLAVTAVSIWMAYPLDEKIVLGLDLRGGTQLLLRVEMAEVPADSRNDVLERAIEIIRNRIDEFGVQEPVVSGVGKDEIMVQLPGVVDRQRALNIVMKTAYLEFNLVSDNPGMSEQARNGNIPEGYKYMAMADDRGHERLLVRKDALLKGSHIKSASVAFDQNGQPIVDIVLDSQGARIFERVTSQYVGRRLAIILDGKLQSAPEIQERIPDGRAQISGDFTPESAHDLALILRAGSLPAPLKVIEERTVGPSLGKESIIKSVRAAFIGALLVFAFMPCYYLLAGFIADVGLLIYGVVVIGALSAFSAVLTLPGIAGFILSIGMAVDANVLINERIREEEGTGKTGRSAIHAGYTHAFSAILDSNVTTLLTALILFIFGTGPVKGFAVTLSIGIIASMFSALFVSRVIFDWLIRKNPKFKVKMFRLFDATSIPFLRRRFWAYGISALTLAVGLAGLLGRGQGNFGVDFQGGTLVQLRFQQPPDIDRIRQILVEQAVREPMIQRYGGALQNEIVIRAKGTDMTSMQSALQRVAEYQKYEIMQLDRIGPAVSRDLRVKALWAVLLGAVGILVYLALRFDRIFAGAAIVALLHDALFTLGVFALSGREINLPIVAAMLTIMGYSVNDTIITFDRVRENLKLTPKSTLKAIVETSVNQTLGRTALTTFTTVLCAAALYFLGGDAINDFAFTLLVGFTVGVYSTIFVAGALVVDWKNRFATSARHKKRGASLPRRPTRNIAGPGFEPEL